MTVGEVHVQLLGGFEVHVDGQQVDPSRWPGRRAADLVQLLALADDHRMLREQVIDALWPQLTPEAGAANLRKAAHHARRALADPESVTLHRGAVALFPARTLTTDVIAFETAAHAALAEEDPSAARRARRSRPGDLLPGIALRGMDPRTTRPPAAAAHRPPAARWPLGALGRPRPDRRGGVSGGDARPTRGRSSARRHLRVRTTPDDAARRAGCGAERGDPGGLRRVRARSGRPRVTLRRARRRTLDHHLTTALPGTDGTTLVAVRGAAGMGKSAFGRRICAIAEKEGWRSLIVSAAISEGPYAALVEAIERLVADEPARARRCGTSSTRRAGRADTHGRGRWCPHDAGQSAPGDQRGASTADGRCRPVRHPRRRRRRPPRRCRDHRGAPPPRRRLVCADPDDAGVPSRGGERDLAARGGPSGTRRRCCSSWISFRSHPTRRVPSPPKPAWSTTPTSSPSWSPWPRATPSSSLELAKSALAGSELRLGTSRHDAIAARFADLDDERDRDAPPVGPRWRRPRPAERLGVHRVR